MPKFVLLLCLLIGVCADASAQTPPVYSPSRTALSRSGIGTIWEDEDGILLLPRTAVSTKAPFGQQIFDETLYIYVPRGDDQDGASGLLRMVSIHFQAGNKADAIRCGHLIARLITLPPIAPFADAPPSGATAKRRIFG